jgi:DNA topoisomerase-1
MASRVLRAARRLAAVPPVASARAAGLRYVADTRPGITRRRTGRAFTYRHPNGRRVRDAADLDRIRRLAIPPAWTEVWISPDPRGHLQATGRDARGRKQYRYHPKWREVRDDTKYDRMIAFGQALSAIRRRTAADLARPGLPREKVLAAVVQLLEKTLIRVGNGEYAKTNNSFGLTTIRDGHVRVNGSRVRFEFRGKGGKRHAIDLTDRRLARIVRRCQELPGYEVFQYIDAHGRRQDVESADVNAYLKEITGQDFTAKDFRTWAGTVLAAKALRELERAGSPAQAKRNIVRAIEAVAARLGNTTAICRKCYVHPAVLDAYMDGSMLQVVRRRVDRALADPRGLTAEETSVMTLLQRRLAREVRARQSA